MPITDVPSPGGWLQLYGVRVAKALVIGAVGAAAALNIYGTANFQAGTGTSTGAVLQVASVTQKQIVPFACATGAGGTSSGGLATYDFCIAALPLTTTGGLLSLGLECGNVPRPFAMSGSFVKARKTSATAASIRNFDTKTIGTGSTVYFGTGYTKWNPSDLLKIQAISATWNTGNDCKMFYELRDKYGS